MKKQEKFKIWVAVFSVLLGTGVLFTGCVKDVAPTDKSEEGLKPNSDDYPDFSTLGDIKLNVNYDYPGGYKALIEVYAENPIEIKDGQTVKKDNIDAIFKAYTDADSRYSGKMTIPTALKKIYLYTREMGLPTCVEVNVLNGEASFDLSKAVQQSASRAQSFRGNIPYTVDQWKKLYSICTWGDQGSLSSEYMTQVNTVDKANGGKESMSKFTDRLRYTLWNKKSEKPHGLNNSQYVRGAEQTNVSIAAKAADGTPIVGASIDVTFVHEGAWNTNTFGYYYYDSSNSNPDLDQLNKYIIIPNVSVKGHYPYNSGGFNAPLKSAGQKFRIKYFGPDGNAEPSDKFPPGYTIGWFIISNGYKTGNNEIDTDKPFLYSNNNACITLYDKATNKLVVGFEDSNSDKSYEDILFFVEADPMKAIVDPENPGKPSIDEGGDITVPDATEVVSGTLAFEDLWPHKGDYDMNDVVVEYRREVLFDKDNIVKKITEEFELAHLGAQYNDAFATNFDGQLGGTLTMSTGAYEETNTGAVILFTTVDAVKGQKYSVVRDFGSGSFKKETMPKWNPFIISRYVQGELLRKEVHLPKHNPTSMADPELLKGDTFYIDKDGKYPFAILLPITGWQVAVEMTPIDQAYPEFSGWVANPQVNTDWYMHPAKDKVQPKK